MLKAYSLALGWVVLSQILPGPNLLAVIAAAFGQGRRAGLFVALGVATAIFIWMGLAAFGLASLFARFPVSLLVLQLLGGAYLSYLSVNALVRSRRGIAQVVQVDSSGWSALGAWRRGLAVNLTNPKSGMMWAMVATFQFSVGLSATQVLAFAPIGFLSALTVYGSYAIIFSRGAVAAFYRRSGWAVETAFGLVLGIIGMSLLWNVLRLALASAGAVPS